jgi:hypothetical protein
LLPLFLIVFSEKERGRIHPCLIHIYFVIVSSEYQTSPSHVVRNYFHTFVD